MSVPQKSEQQTFKEYVADLYEVQDQVGMTAWERDFVSDLQHRSHGCGFLTPKQKEFVLRLVEKYDI